MQLQIRSSIWRFLLCFLFFVSSLQCLHAAPALRSSSQPRVKFGSLFKKGSSNTVSGSDHSGGGGASSSGSLSAPAPASPPPRPDVFYPGEFVGVRVKGYTPGSKIDTIHPGIVISGPTTDRIYTVAMISKKLPGDPPQKPVSTYQSGTGMEGNISLAPVQVSWGKMKIWRQRDTGTGQQEPKLSEAKLQKLLTDIENARGGSSSASASTSRLSGSPRARPLRSRHVVRKTA